jgi:flagellar biosynthesis/type III secretory pathway M-ring protein FliF/YscJ
MMVYAPIAGGIIAIGIVIGLLASPFVFLYQRSKQKQKEQMAKDQAEERAERLAPLRKRLELASDRFHQLNLTKEPAEYLKAQDEWMEAMEKVADFLNKNKLPKL